MDTKTAAEVVTAVATATAACATAYIVIDEGIERSKKRKALKKRSFKAVRGIA